MISFFQYFHPSIMSKLYILLGRGEENGKNDNEIPLTFSTVLIIVHIGNSSHFDILGFWKYIFIGISVFIICLLLDKFKITEKRVGIGVGMFLFFFRNCNRNNMWSINLVNFHLQQTGAIHQEGSMAILIEVRAEYSNNKQNFYVILKIKMGDVMKVLVFFLFVALVIFLVETISTKIFGVEKKRISETSGKNIDRWGRGIIAVIFLSILPFVISLDFYIMKWYWILFTVVLFGFQSFLERKFLKGSKQYITSLIYLILMVIIFYNIEYFI